MLREIKSIVREIPFFGPALKKVWNNIPPRSSFQNSASYWEDRYRNFGDSGDGSYGRLAEFKAEVLNKIIQDENIETVIEFGCGDGAQLGLLNIKNYIGVDVSETVIKQIKKKFKDDDTKKFFLVHEYDQEKPRAELALSLDVIYHLIEDDVFNQYMSQLFSSAEKIVIIYSSNHEELTKFPHVRHREFLKWVEENCADEWKFEGKICQKFPFQIHQEDKTSFADFYIFINKRFDLSKKCG